MADLPHGGLVGFGGTVLGVPGVVVLSVEFPPPDGAVCGTVDGNVVVLVESDVPGAFVVALVVEVMSVVGTIGEPLSSDPHAPMLAAKDTTMAAANRTVRARDRCLTRRALPGEP